MNRITVNQAISKGQKWVNYPVFGIMLLGFGLTMYLMTIVKNVWIFPIGFVSTIALMWLWWSFVITKWRIWAFGNCRNVHELKRKAIEQKLIWDDNSWFNKTEIWSNEQRKRWIEIEKMFVQEGGVESIHDDGQIPNQTIIKNSEALKWKYGVMILGGLIFAYLELKDGEIFLPIFIIGISIFGGIFLLPKVLDSSPQIILTNEGIKFKDANLVSWSKVKKANVVLQGSGKNARWYLDIDYRSKDSNGNLGEYIELSNFNLNPGKIEERIKIYRQRERKRKNR